MLRQRCCIKKGVETVLIKKESLDKFVDTLIGRPVVIRHQEVTNDNIKKVDVGRVTHVWFDVNDVWYWCDGIITDDKALNLINSGWSVSCSYNVTLLDDKGGMENNIPYDMEFLDGVFTHLALVDNPRYESAMVVLNSKTERKDIISDVFFEALAEVIVENGLGKLRANNKNDGGKWITIKPHGDDADDYKRLKLQEGETPKEAMKRQWGVDIDKKEKKQQKDTKSKKADEYKKKN